MIIYLLTTYIETFFAWDLFLKGLRLYIFILRYPSSSFDKNMRYIKLSEFI